MAGSIRPIWDVIGNKKPLKSGFLFNASYQFYIPATTAPEVAAVAFCAAVGPDGVVGAVGVVEEVLPPPPPPPQAASANKQQITNPDLKSFI